MIMMTTTVVTLSETATSPDEFNCSLHQFEIDDSLERFSSYHNIQRSLRNILTPILCTLGCLGNVINLLVLRRLRCRRSTSDREIGAHIGLSCLAVSDFCICATLLPRSFVPSTTSMFERMDLALLYQAYGSGLVNTFIFISTWITVVMSSIRYLGICHPFSARRINGPLFSKVAYSLVFGLCCAFNIPMFLQFKILRMDMGSRQSYLLDIGLFDHRSIQGRVFIWSKAIVGLFVPSLIMTFCNMELIRTLRRSYRMRQACGISGQSSVVSRRLTRTLVAVVLAFVILAFPSGVMDFLSSSLHMEPSVTEHFLLVRSFANILLIANFSLNFILYCATNVHFRTGFSEVVSLDGRVSLACVAKQPAQWGPAAPSFSVVRTTSSNFNGRLTRRALVIRAASKLAKENESHL